MALATLLTASSIASAQAVFPPSQPPYPQPYYGPPSPAQRPPYPQPPYPPPQYPQQQYPQPYPPAYPPYAAPPPSPPPAPPPASIDSSTSSSGSFSTGKLLLGGGASVALGIAGSRLAVDQGPEWRTFSGGLAVAGAGGVSVGPLNALTRGSFFLGGGGGGLEGALGVDSYAGIGVPVTSFLQIFGGLGIGARGMKNDEIDATTITLPGAMLGVQLAVNGFSVVLAPTAGLAARTDYGPGDELQGRRFFRRTGMQLGYGGTAAIFTEYFSVHGSLQRLAMSDPVLSGDAAACIHVKMLALCGFGQYWRANATNAQGTTLMIPTLHAGVLLGIGSSAAGAVTF